MTRGPGGGILPPGGGVMEVSDCGEGRDRLLRVVALLCAVSAVLLCAGAVAVFVTSRARGLPVAAPYAGDLVVGTLFPLAGLLVLWRQPRNSSGWVLLSCTSVAVSTLAHAWMHVGAVTPPGTVPVFGLAVWLSAWTYAPYWLQPVLLPLLFPHGRLPSASWRPFVRTVAGLFIVLLLAGMLGPNDSISGSGLPNPLGIGEGSRALTYAFMGAQMGSGLLLWLVAAPVALVSLVCRQRRASGQERAQLQWLMLGFVGLLVLSVARLPLPEPWGEVQFAAAFACVPVTLVIAVLRHRMLDVELVVGRTLAYAGLTALAVLAYVRAVTLAGRWLQADGAGPVVAAVVVATAASLRSRGQRWVDRRLFGARRDPYAVLQVVGSSTAAAAAPDAALQALTDAVREALRLPFVQVLDDQGTSVAASGEPVAGTHVVPVVDRGRRLGVLVVGRRWRGERQRPEEASALVEVARRAGALLSERALTLDLQRSYRSLVRVREEERRRLRRELHDGVGPALAGTALQLDSLAGRLGDSPDLAARAERLRDRLQSAVSDVRRVVDGLRPAAVDELGLPGALRALGTEDDDPVTVRVQADLPDGLPADVEAATYRIASEAVANALRHACARRAEVTASFVDGTLHLQVVDDGNGFGADVTAGVGLQSMHDRAAEIGGTLIVDSTPGAGTAVRAMLPVQRR